MDQLLLQVKHSLFPAQINIKEIFNPEEAPWFGGFWERLVKSVKKCIKKTTGCIYLTFTEIETLFFKIEHILNLRPLTTLFDNDNEQTLTPNHLLYGQQLAYTNRDNENTIECKKKFSTHINHIKLILQHFWSRWKKDYLLSLQAHVTHYKRGCSEHPSINDIVIVYEEKQPWQCWQMGKIVELVESKDKNIQSAKVLTGKTQNVVTRPINRLYPVEFTEEFSHAAQNKVEINQRAKTRRKATVTADLKQKFLQ